MAAPSDKLAVTATVAPPSDQYNTNLTYSINIIVAWSHWCVPQIQTVGNHPIELDVSFKSEVVEFGGYVRLSRNSASLPVATSNWHKHVSTIYNA